VLWFLSLILAGVFVGVLGGMFGFGGSSLSTPVLRIFFNIPAYLALASPLPMTLLSSSVAAYRYQKEDMIDWGVAKKMLVVLVPGSFLGAYVTKYVSGQMLMLLTALFLLYVAIRFILPRKEKKETVASTWVVLLAGFAIGFVSGLLANGGGIFVVPVLVLLGMGIKRAIGTSMAMVFFTAIPSILVHWYLGHIDWVITLALTIGAIPGAYLGSWLTVNMNREKLQKIYGVFLLVFAAYFAVTEL
jgi:hypothetical protein